MASYSAGDIENRFCPTCGYLDYCGDPYEIHHPLVNKQAEEMPVWAVYKHPKDFPGKYMAMLWTTAEGHTEPTESIIVSLDYKIVQKQLQAKNLERFPADPHEEDDPSLIETWC